MTTGHSGIPPWQKHQQSDPNDPSHPGHSEYLIHTDGYIAERVGEVTDLPQKTQNDLIEICRGHIRERCGLITTDYEIVGVHNVHENPEFNFYMDHDDFNQSLEYIYQETQREVLGIWHTHPNNWPWPTPRDIVGWPDSLIVDWRYFVVTNDNVIEWRKVRGSETPDLAGNQ